MRRSVSAVLAVVMTALLLLSGCAQKEERMTVSVACIVDQPLTDGMEALQMEQRQIPVMSGTELYRRMIAEMTRTPANAQLSAALPGSAQLKDFSLEDGVAVCTFSENLTEQSPAVLTRMLGAVTHTLCQLPEINAVRILAGSAPLHEGNLTDAEFVVQRESLHITDRELLLYYPNEDASGLDTAMCSVRLTEDANAAQAVMETLLSGPVTAQGYIIRFLADGTRLYSAKVSNGICYVNLSKEFLNENIVAPDGTSLTVYAIVNSLTALPEVSGVQFLIEGEIVQSYMHPHFDQVIVARTQRSLTKAEEG